MSELDKTLDNLLEKRKRKGRFRSLKDYDTSESSDLVDFSSNDYLSLTTSPSLRSAYLERLARTESILGSTGSRLLSGGTRAHKAVETQLATHFDAAAALLFNSGWDANVSLFSTAPQPADWIVYDELVHASVHSGMRASRVPAGRRVAFAHNDPEGLAGVLGRIAAVDTEEARTHGLPESTVFLALESLYSMDGDFAPLPALLAAFHSFVPANRRCVIVDEAHSTGVYGVGGRGVVSALKLEQHVHVRLMTFGKGVGASGAVLLCSPTVRSFLINFARPFIFSTAMPHSTLLAVSCAWEHLASDEGDAARQQLYAIVREFEHRLKPLFLRAPPKLLRLPDATPVPFPGALGLPERPPAPIIGLLTPNPHALSAFLLQKGFIVRPVVPPTVPPGGERVRVCLRAGIGEGEIRRLVAAISEWVEEKLEKGAARL